MTPIAQLMQLLQAPVPIPGQGETAEGAQPVAGLAELFGKMLEEAQLKLIAGATETGESTAQQHGVVDPAGALLEAATEVADIETAETAIPIPESEQPDTETEVTVSAIVSTVIDEVDPELQPETAQPPPVETTDEKGNNTPPLDPQPPPAHAEAVVLAAHGPPIVKPESAGGPHVIKPGTAATPAAPQLPEQAQAAHGMTVRTAATQQRPSSAETIVGDTTVETDEAATKPALSELVLRAIARNRNGAAGNENAPAQPSVTGDNSAIAAASAKVAETAAQVAPPHGGELRSAQELAASGAVRNSLDVPVQKDAVETVHIRQVGDFTVRSVKYLTGHNTETINVRLVPRSLGEMQISIRAGEASLEVILTTATHAVRDTLELQLSGLRESLAREGVEVTKVTVQTFTTTDSGPGNSQSGQAAQNGHAARAAQRFSQGYEQPEAEHRPSPDVTATHEGTINMLV